MTPLALHCPADQNAEDERLKHRAICRVLAMLTFGLTGGDDCPVARHFRVQAAARTHHKHVGHLYLASLMTARWRRALCRQALEQ
jgi:hypothetical protein